MIPTVSCTCAKQQIQRARGRIRHKNAITTKDNTKTVLFFIVPFS